MTDNNWVGRITRALGGLFNDDFLQLVQISENLASVGLTKPAEEIRWIAADMQIRIRAVRNAALDELDSQMANSEIQTGALLKAVLAGCIVAPAAETNLGEEAQNA